ncbi:MAG TPA: chemotaxis protein CheA [Desulfuromonadaceae bacterium]
MDMSQYRDLFVSEARGHMTAFTDLLVRCEGSAAEPGDIDELFRHAHSLKGMAASMQFQPIAELAHRMEDLLSKVRSGEFSLTSAMIDLLLEGGDILGGMIATVEEGDDRFPDCAELIDRLHGFIPETTSLHATVPLPDRAGPETTPGVPPSPRQHQFRQSDSFKNIRIRTAVLDHLVNITGELITTRYRLADQAHRCPEAMLDEPLGQLSAYLRDLRDEVFKARMLPFSFVAERFPRLVRDLSRAQGKEIMFSLEGKEIELDRGILEEITDPLVHILRNAVDHGMETPPERLAAGKTASGAITVTVTRDKDHVTICVADDGRGMDPALLIARAVEKGVISSDRASTLTREEALLLVCAPGFSTAAAVSDISGRGVGMDVVSTAVHGLGGTLSIETEIGRGSHFILTLPITVSIINALLVRCGRLTLAFPVTAVDRALELGRKDILDREGQKVCKLGDTLVPLKSLNRLLDQPPPKGGLTCVPAIVSGLNATPVALLTDRILGQQEIFVKPLGLPLSRMGGITGGTILGDGHIVFVMDIRTFT